MSAGNFCQIALGPNVQHGRRGPRVKAVSGTFQARNAADATFVTVAGADPVAGDDFVTKRWGLANLDPLPPGLPHANSIIFYVDAADFGSYPGTGTAVADRTGNGTNGTIDGGAVVSGGAFQIDSAAKGVSFDKNATLDNLFDGGATVMTFAQTQDSNTDGRLVATENNGSTLGWMLYGVTSLSVATQPRLRRMAATTNGQWQAVGGIPRGTNATSGGGFAYGSIAVTYDDSLLANDPSFYINGVFDSTPAGTNPVGALGSDVGESLVIGNRNGGGASMNGQSQITVIWSRILTAQEIQQVHNLFIARLGRNGSVPGVVAQQSDGGLSRAMNLLGNHGAAQPSIAAGNSGCINLQYQTTASTGFTGTNTDFASILGGINNIMGTGGDGSVIAGGEGNIISVAAQSPQAAICGGFANIVYGDRGFIGAGSDNEIQRDYGVICGGFNNKSYGGDYGFIGGGDGCHLGLSTSTFIAQYGVVSGGFQNRVMRSNYGTIAGGRSNRIGFFATSDHSWIEGGRDNTVGETTGVQYGNAAGRRSKCNHLGASIKSDSTDQDEISDRDNQHKRVFVGGFAERTTVGFAEEQYERFNAHLTLTGVSANGTVVLGTLPTNTRTLDVSNLRVHAIRTNSTAGVADTFASQGGFTGRRRNDGNQAIFVQSLVAGSEGTGVNVTAVLQVTGNNYEVSVTLPAIQPSSETWQITIRWERQVGGQP